MEQAIKGALERGRAAFEHREWHDAFELLTTADREQKLDADDLARLAESARWSANYDAMLNGFERAEAAYERSGERRRAARMAFDLCIEHYYRKNDSAFMGWFARASSLLEHDTECTEYGFVLWGQARFLSDEGKVDDARLLLEQMLELAGRIDTPEVEALARLDLGHLLIVEGNVRDGLRMIDEANALAMGGTTALWIAGSIYCSTIWACRNIGDWRRASQWTDSSMRWCERESVSHFPGLCRFHRAEVLRVRGALDEAELDAHAAIEDLLAGNPLAAPWAYMELGEIRRRRGDLPGAASAFRTAVELGFDPQPGLALLRLAEGKPKAALRSITDALADESVFAREGRSFLLPAQVTIAIAAGELGAARLALTELEERAAASGSIAFHASATCAAGEVALAIDDHAAAVSALRQGIRQWHEVDAPFEAAQARVLLARAYRGLEEEDEAILELEAAHDAFARLGAHGEARRVNDLLEARRQDRRSIRTFLFTDIVDSTRLVEALGDEDWENVLRWHDRTLRQCIESHGGEEVKNEGDGFFVAFLDARAALECATEMQRTLASHRLANGFAPRVRVGAHTAEATERGGDYSGHGVHVAARIAASAGAGEIVASSVTLDSAGEGFTTTDVRAVELKGLTVLVEVATVAWE